MEQLAWFVLGLVMGANVGFVVLGVVTMGADPDKHNYWRM